MQQDRVTSSALLAYPLALRGLFTPETSIEQVAMISPPTKPSFCVFQRVFSAPPGEWNLSRSQKNENGDGNCNVILFQPPGNFNRKRRLSRDSHNPTENNVKRPVMIFRKDGKHDGFFVAAHVLKASAHTLEWIWLLVRVREQQRVASRALGLGLWERQAGIKGSRWYSGMDGRRREDWDWCGRRDGGRKKVRVRKWD